MTDEERYPPPYEDEAAAKFRRAAGARESLRDGGCWSSIATTPVRRRVFPAGRRCSPGSTRRCTAFRRRTGSRRRTRIPTWDGWTRTRCRHWATGSVPAATRRTIGASGMCRTPISSCRARTMAHGLGRRRQGHRRGGRGVPEGGPARPFGFSGWIGREPHGAANAIAARCATACSQSRSSICSVSSRRARSDGPWLAVASFVNPHDIAFAGGLWELLLGFPPPDDSVPEIPEAPSQSDSFAGRPACQEQFKAVWPKLVAEQPADLAYRRLYYYLLKLVDQAIGRILEALDDAGSPTTRSSCSRRITATCSARTADCNRSGTTRSTKRSGCRSGEGPGRVDDGGRDRDADQSCRPHPDAHGTRRHRRRTRRGRSRRASRRGPAASRP